MLLMAAGLVLAAYFQPLPVILLAGAIAVVVIAWVRPFWVFGGLVVLLPFHDQMLRIATWQLSLPSARITALSLWKEGVIALLLVLLVIQHLTGRRRIRAKLYHFDLWLLALLVLSAAYIVVAGSLSIGVFGFRNYFEPLAIFFLARLLPYSRHELKALLVVLALVAAGVAAYGIFQAQLIDFETMIRMGYVDEYGNLPFAFKTALRDGQPRPRAISTVTGPNQLAIYLDLFFLLATYALVYLIPRRGPKPGVAGSPLPGASIALVALAALYGICLLLTFSRGGLLALGVSLLAWGAIIVVDRGIKRTWLELRQNRLALVGLLGALVLAGAGLVVSGFARRILRGLTGQDPAALGHLTSMDAAVDFISGHPLGTGLGMAGPRALRFVSEAQIQHTESTYLQFGMETGLLGMLLLLLLLLSLIATMWRLRQKRKAGNDLEGRVLTEVSVVAWIGALAVFTVTPLMQNFLVASYLWLIAGITFHLDAYEMVNDH